MREDSVIMMRMTVSRRPVILFPLLFLVLGDRVRAFNCTEPEHKRMQARRSAVFFKNIDLIMIMMIIMIINDKAPLRDRWITNQMINDLVGRER